MKKHCILITLFVIMTLSLKSQNKTPYLISKLQPIKGESGDTVKLSTNLTTGINAIKMSFGIDLQAVKHKYWIKTNIGDTESTEYFDFTQKSEIADFVIRKINKTFDNSTKKISLEILYSSTLNEVRYIWTNNNVKSQIASIVSIDRPLEINKLFPYLTFTQLDGRTITTKDLANKYVIINRWFTGCPPCRKEIPGLNKLVEKYKNNKEIIFIAIATDSKQTLENYLTKNEFNYVQTIAGSGFNEIFGTIFPTNIVVNPKGIITYNSGGGNENKYLEIEKEIERIMKEN